MNKFIINKVTVLGLLVFVSNLFAAGGETGRSYQNMTEQNALVYIQGLYDAYSSAGLLKKHGIESCSRNESSKQRKNLLDEWIANNKNNSDNSAGSLLIDALKQHCNPAISKSGVSTEVVSQQTEVPAKKETMAEYVLRMQKNTMKRMEGGNAVETVTAPQIKLEAINQTEITAKNQAEELARTKALQLAEQESRKKAETEVRLQAEIAARKQAEFEVKRKAETAAKRQAESAVREKSQQQVKQQTLAQQAEFEARRKAEVVDKRQAAAREIARQQSKQKAELEAKRNAEMATNKKADAVAREKSQQLAKQKAQIQQAELEARRKASAKRKAEVAAREKAEQQAKQKAQAELAVLEAKRKAETAAKKQAEEDDRKRLEAVAKQLHETPLSANTLTGREILDESARRHDQRYEYEVQKMTLVDKAGNKDERTLRRFMREINDNETRYLSVFLSPSGVKGVGLLTWQHDNSADDQWLYLPANGKKMKRIAKGGKKNYFMGTDYTYEDLVSESRDKFKYEKLADESIGGSKTFVVKATATHPSVLKETGYSYRKLWIRQDNFVVVQVDFFDKRKRRIKRQKSSNLVKIKGQVWRSNRSVIEHFIKKHKTITVITKRSFNQSSVPEKNFRERTIVSGRVLR